jgi:hypothetical protein
MTKTKTLEELVAATGAMLAERPQQLPLWPPSERVMPNEFISASVFSALQRQDAKRFDKMTPIGEWNGYKLRYKGLRLTQVHADVWQGILEVARWHKPTVTSSEGVLVQFNPRQLLKLIGRDTGSAGRQQLHEWLTDMQAAVLEITMPGGRGGYGAAILPECAWQKQADGSLRYSIRLHRFLCDALDRGFAAIDWPSRRLLARNELALWLQQYLAAFPVPTPVADLQGLSGRSAMLKDFRFKLRGSMALLVKAKVVTSWAIDDEDRLVVKVAPRLQGGDRVQPGTP